MLLSSVSMYTVPSCFVFISLSVYYVKCIVESYLAFCACIQRMVVQYLVVQACAPRVYCICCPPLPPLFKENGAEGGRGKVEPSPSPLRAQLGTRSEAIGHLHFEHHITNVAATK